MEKGFLDRIKDELNKEQLQAVEYVEGPSLVIAGAGSGKTRVLTYKIAYLLEQGIKPWNILALTFTNKAAREMKERIARLVGEELAASLWMGTFHSVFSRILRREADLLGFSPRFTIYDQADSRNVVKTIVKAMGLDDKVYKPAVVADHISRAKNRLILPQAYVADPQVAAADQAARIPLAGEIYGRYMDRLRQADAMDFDDLLLHTYLLLKEHEEVCERYADKFDFVLVDEYQDTNFAQHRIVWELTRTKQKVCVVGDDAQSIYSFRGANIDNILDFNEMYEGAKTFKLEQNYRSTQTIVSAANSLIRHNDRQIRKDVFSEKEKGDPIRLYAAYSDFEEAEIVTKKMAELHRREGMDYDAFAILYRTNAQSRAFEEALRRRNIPYRIYGGLSFYQRKEVKDAIAYCRLAVNPRDEEAFKRVVNYPARGIGQTTVEKIMAAASGQGTSLWDVATDPEGHALPVNKGTMAKISSFTDIVRGFIKRAGQADAATLMREIVQGSGMVRDIFGDTTPEGMSRQENLQELLNGAQAFVQGRMEEGRADEAGMSDFLQEVSLLSDLDEDDGDDSRKVTLMTIHSAKGLEFQAVFVVGMEENLFPSPMAGEGVRALEEERRLFYVALTRAEKYCFLSFARSRFRFGKTEFSNPSRFLHDIDPRYVVMDGQGGGEFAAQARSRQDREAPRHMDSRMRPAPSDEPWLTRRPAAATARVTGLKPLARVRPAASARTDGASARGSVAGAAGRGDGCSLQAGMQIEHERFGRGVVKAVEGSGENTKATVEFRNTGTKQLLLRFARFKVVD